MTQRTLTISADDLALGTREADIKEVTTIGAAIVALMGKSPRQTDAIAELGSELARNALTKCGITIVDLK